MRLFNRTIKDLFRQRTKVTFSPSIEIQRLENFPSKFLEREVAIDVYLPPGHYLEPAMAAYPYVIFNDGQDLDAVGLVSTLERLWRMARLPHLIAVGIQAGDRMQEFGTAHRPDYQQRGSRASAYAQFVTLELLPMLRRRYHLSEEVTDAAIAGFSLGGLSALDIAWQYPQVFSKVGVFSGSLWWRSRAFRPEDPDADRIAHEMIAQGPYRVDMKFWLQTGTLDETADRNNNGIIDSIDDTLDLIAELETVGYRQGADIRYVEMEGGEHNPHTWGEAMPDFLQWVFS
jgi:enterochelin esterase-like enzyme